MARASDYQFISEGLDSIAQARVRRLLQDYQAQRDAEEKRRYDEQMARQLSADKAVADWRTQQGQRQTDLLAFQKQQAADNKAFREGQLTRGAQAQADAQAQNQAFSNLLLGGEAAPQETSQFEHLNPTGEAQPLTGEGVAKAAAGAGILTPDMARNLADTALRERALTAKGGAPTDNKPQHFEFTLPDGKLAYGLYSPRTGKFETKFNGQTLEAVPLKNSQTGEVIPDQFVVGTGANARVMSFKSKPIDTSALFDRYWKARDRAYGTNKETGQPNFPIKARTPENNEWQIAMLEEQTIEHALRAATGQDSGAAPAAPAPASPAAAAPVPVIGLDGAFKTPPGGNAPTPPDNREQDAGVTVSPVAVQAPKPAVSSAPIPARPSPAAQTSEAIGDLTDDDFTRTVRSFPPDQQNSIREALLEALARKMGLKPGAESLRIGGSRLFRNPSSHVEAQAGTPEFSQFWNSLPPDEKAALLKSALIGGRVTKPTTGTTLGRLPTFK